MLYSRHMSGASIVDSSRVQVAESGVSAMLADLKTSRAYENLEGFAALLGSCERILAGHSDIRIREMFGHLLLSFDWLADCGNYPEVGRKLKTQCKDRGSVRPLDDVPLFSAEEATELLDAFFSGYEKSWLFIALPHNFLRSVVESLPAESSFGAFWAEHRDSPSHVVHPGNRQVLDAYVCKLEATIDDRTLLIDSYLPSAAELQNIKDEYTFGYAMPEISRPSLTRTMLEIAGITARALFAAIRDTFKPKNRSS